MINIGAVKQIGYAYLLVPLALFGIGWLSWAAAAIFCLLIGLSMLEIRKQRADAKAYRVKESDLVITLAILGTWLLFSGVGGYTFQNWDHHSRNAVFHDLISYSWPVAYRLNPTVSSQIHVPSGLMLSYYLGFWLPSALVGKLFGWPAANAALFLWTYLGIALIVLLTASKLSISLWKAALLLIFFSGTDTIGVLLLRQVPGYTYPALWPPVQHLEWWAGSLQYSSFTTDLYWTYNQFVPTLLVTALFLVNGNIGSLVFLGGICLFYAPFPAAGLLPFLAGSLAGDLINNLRRGGKAALGLALRSLLSFGSLAGLVISGVSLLFFSTNLAGQVHSFGRSAPMALYLIFVLLEGMLLWLWLLPMHRQQWAWYVVGGILVFAPFVNVGGSWDFMARATIPALYVLMLGAAECLATRHRPVARLVVACFLCLGALTPLYEVDRSVARTVCYYRWPVVSALDAYFTGPPPQTNQAIVPEFDHPGTLVADDWGTVINLAEIGWDTKAGTLFSPSWGWLWRETLIQEPE